MTINGRLQTYKSYWQAHRWIDYLLLSIFITGIALINLLWLHAEHRPPHWDMARHLWNSLNYYDFLRGHDVSSLTTSYLYYPPFIYWIASCFYIVFKPTLTAAVMSNMVFISIAAYATYGTGRAIWGRRTGLLASVFLLTSPMMVTQFKEFQIDAPLTAIVCLVLYFLVASRDFAKRHVSILLGVSLGIGMLTKWTFGFIIALPIGASILIGTYKAWQEKSWDRMTNILLCLLIAYSLASIWYLPNKHQLVIDLTQNGANAGVREGDPAVGTYTSNIWYGWNLISNQLYLIPFLAFITGLAFTVRKKVLSKNRYPLLLALGTLLFFTMLRNKDARYTLPALAGIAIIATYWISLLKNKLAQNLTSIVLILYGFIAFTSISLGMRFLPQDLSIAANPYPITLFAQHGYIIAKPSSENWQLEDAIKYASKQPDATFSYQGGDSIWLNGWDLVYYAKRYGAQLTASAEAASLLIVRTAAGQVYSTQGNQKIIKRVPLPDKGELIYVKQH